MPKPSIQNLTDAFAESGYTLFKSGAYNLNLIGLRNKSVAPNAFDDAICALYRDLPGNWKLEVFRATTDPGTYWLENPGRVNGTAILVPGQHKGAFTFGKHHNTYECFVQKTELPVWRDADKDAIPDFHQATVYRGHYGIQIHRANASRASTEIGKWSAGCQVVADPVDFARLLELGHLSAKSFGSTFTYSLLEWDFS